jgi:hypothetical protein
MMIKKIHKKMNNRWMMLWIAAAILFMILLLGAYSYLPLSREAMKHTLAEVECRHYYVLTANSHEIMFFGDLDKDSTFLYASMDKDSATRISSHTACWVHKYQFVPSCEGRVMALFAHDSSDSLQRLLAHHLPEIVNKEMNRLAKDIKRWKKINLNMKYYLRVHNATDEGFYSISKYAEAVTAHKDSSERLLDAIRKAAQTKSLKIKYVTKYTVSYFDDSLKRQKAACHLLHDKNGNFRFLQTDDETTPDGAQALYFHLWMTWHIAKLAPGKMAPFNVPEALAADGSPIFSKYGFFIGILHEGEVLSSDRFKLSLLKMKTNHEER